MRWLKLFLLNFLGVLNDNFMKHCIIFVSVGWVMPEWMTQSQLIATVSAALVLPYLLLSPYSGEIAERFEKQKIVRLMKLLELPIVALAGVGFWTESVWVVLLAVLLMGVQSCLYSPAKYGLIRDVEGENGVAFGSGMFEMMAFLGILIGTVLAAYLSDHYAWWIVAAVMLGLAIIGYYLSKILGIVETQYIEAKVEKQTRNPIKFLIQSYKFASEHKGLNKAVFGASLLWLLGGLLQMNVVLHCTRTLGMSNTASSIILAMAAVGIAVGCSVTGKLIENRNKRNFIIGGLVGVALLLAIVLIFKPQSWLLGALVFGVAFCGGMFQVPCLAMVQSADIGRKLGSMLAYLNLLTFIFVLLGTAIFSIITMFTAQNSYVVFVVMLIITLLSLMLFVLKDRE
jgi:acyl-[acyl-carrier-protein]-phospholipid O-acyltransferase/long-chain-fatty-acid--[acyl-carrier-protein] ligase